MSWNDWLLVPVVNLESTEMKNLFSSYQDHFLFTDDSLGQIFERRLDRDRPVPYLVVDRVTEFFFLFRFVFWVDLTPPSLLDFHGVYLIIRQFLWLGHEGRVTRRGLVSLKFEKKKV